MAWRIEIDRDLCQGHGVCESEAPRIFEAPDKGQVVVLDATPPDEARQLVELAEKFCPTHAIRIVED